MQYKSQGRRTYGMISHAYQIGKVRFDEEDLREMATSCLAEL